MYFVRQVSRFKYALVHIKSIIICKVKVESARLPLYFDLSVVLNKI